MLTFDYASAWHNFARPMFDALPDSIKDCVWFLQELKDLPNQDQKLDLPWPPDERLKNRMNQHESLMLATAASVVYDYGHWCPLSTLSGEEKNNGVGSRRGEYWRFSMYCDRILRGRACGGETRDSMSVFDTKTSYGNGTSLQILEGCVRIQLEYPGGWIWSEVGPADEDGIRIAKEHAQHLMSDSYGKNTDMDQWDARACSVDNVKMIHTPTLLNFYLKTYWKKHATVVEDNMRSEEEIANA